MLKIWQIKPNPEGKDRYDGVSDTPVHQVSSEWIDLKYDSLVGHYIMGGVKLQKQIEKDGQVIWWDVLEFPTDIHFELGAEKVLRIHSGKLMAEAAMERQDREGADFHFFTQKSFVWSNKNAENIRILDKDGKVLDEAAYDPWPPEGEILHRNDKNKLIYVFKEQG